MTWRLSKATLESLPASIAAPLYDRAKIVPGIVHLGLGAFHRAHQAAYVDECLAAGEAGWGIVGASLRSADTRDALAPQDGLYTLAVRHGQREDLRVIGSIVSTLVAPENPEALLDALADPGIRIVTLTVTEKAYLRDAAGDLDIAHPDIAWDLSNPGKPKTLYGFLAKALLRRTAAGAPLFTVLCCDNLPANGATLRRLLLQFAAKRGDGLEGIASQVAFPSSMVDRIVPATTDEDRARICEQLGVDDAWPVMTEPFCQWVIEDRFTAGRPDWERFGVTMVEDVSPFEDMKLRLLNGSHSAIAYLGLLLGHATVAEAFADKAIRRFVEGLWGEAIPTLPKDAELDPAAYTKKLTDRYDNTALQHRTAQIAIDGSQKLPQRIIASALQRAGENADISHLMLVVAAWIAACEARGTQLDAGLFTDPLDGPLAAIAADKPSAADTVTRVFDAAGFAKGHTRRDRLAKATASHLQAIRGKGVAFALLELAKKKDSPS
ncbi:fructuronate reductase [Mesorhizobium albiziae]|uniref:Fructuronate reductase n=1 Tax=Neomesorhizobium albiziae TaxID=335020 RepID=A0A1I4AWG2_9HYPH|nr:mannitol dehydrogenase family protein [Mesorhizobium albiziae]GLS34154.1 mannitol dehydrogenase [Mesorhizobium albiziae]SFK60815.1 fructuronate reductase [Mesorhizobium albiziae]